MSNLFIVLLAVRGLLATLIDIFNHIDRIRGIK